MVRCASLFSQLLAVFNRTGFCHLVAKHGAERYAKGYNSWDHFTAMLFCQLAQAKSLREICGGLACCIGKLQHLGMKDAPNKSTLSYANGHRPWEMFRDLFYETLEVCRTVAPGKDKKFRFKNKLLSMDSSTISLCLSLFPWAKFRRTKGAVKLHLLLDHDGYLPTYAYFDFVMLIVVVIVLRPIIFWLATGVRLDRLQPLFVPLFQLKYHFFFGHITARKEMSQQFFNVRTG